MMKSFVIAFTLLIGTFVGLQEISQQSSSVESYTEHPISG